MESISGSIIDDLKARARILHCEAKAGQPEALQRLHKHPELRALEAEQLRHRLRRRHCLGAVARELGFSDFPHAKKVLSARGAVEDFGTLLYPPGASAHWNIWSASYEEARQIRAEHGGYLLAYRHQFLIVDRYFIETLGLNPDDPDWQALGRDWVRPADPAARMRLYGRLLQRSRRPAAQAEA